MKSLNLRPLFIFASLLSLSTAQAGTMTMPDISTQPDPHIEELIIIDLVLQQDQTFELSAHNIYLQDVPALTSSIALSLIVNNNLTISEDYDAVINTSGIIDLGLWSIDDPSPTLFGDVFIRSLSFEGNNIDLTLNASNNLYVYNSISVSQVPVPAAAWLFGSALVGLAGIKRRK